MKNPLSTIVESLKQGAEVLKNKIDDTAKNFKKKFDQAVDKITSSMEWAKKEFETAVNKITAALTQARDEMRKAGADLKKSLTELSVVASLNKAGDKLVEAIQGIANRVRQAGKGIKSSGKGGGAIPAAGKTGGESSGKTTTPVKNTKKDSPSAGGKKSDTITVSATPKPQNGYQINKGANKNVSVDTKYKPKTKPKPQPKQNRPKRRKEEPKNNNKTQKTRRRGGRKGKASARGGGEGLNGMDFNKVADTITQIQGHVSGMITSLDKAIETGDMTPVVQELAKIPGPVGKVADVALQSFKIGNQMYDFYMKNMGGNERDKKDFDAKQKKVNKSYSKQDRQLKLRKDSHFKDYLDYLLKVNKITKQQAEDLKKRYESGDKNVSGRAYTEAGQLKRAHEREQDDKKRLGKTYDNFKNKEKAIQANTQKETSEHQKKISNGEIKAGSDLDFEVRQKILLKNTEELRKLLQEAKKLKLHGDAEKIKQRINENNQKFDSLDKQRSEAADKREDDQKLSDKGLTLKDEIANRQKKRAALQLKSENLESRADEGDSVAKQQRKQIADQMQAEKKKIDELKVELAKQEKAKKEQTKVAANSGGMQGDQCYEKLEEIRKLLEKSVADGKSGQSAQAKAQDAGEGGKKKELASSDDSMGFGGDVAETTSDNKKFQSTLPVKTSQAKPDGSSAQNGSTKANMVATKSKPESKMDRMDAEIYAALRGFPSGGSPVGGEENKMNRMDAENSAAARSSLRGFPSGSKFGRGKKSGRKIAGKYGFRDIPAFNSGPALAMALGDEKALPAMKAAEISDKTKLATSMGTTESASQQAFVEIKRILKHIDETINSRLPGDNF